MVAKIESCIALQEDAGSVLDNIKGNIRHKRRLRTDKTVKRVWEVVQGIQRIKCLILIFFFTVVPCILMSSRFFIYQLMHNRVALKEY